MTNEFEEEVFGAMDDLRGDNRVAVPDVGTIRRRAAKQQNRMRAAAGAACLAVVATVGFGVWSSADDSTATTETAGVDDGVGVDQPQGDSLSSVADDSAPVELAAPGFLGDIALNRAMFECLRAAGFDVFLDTDPRGPSVGSNHSPESEAAYNDAEGKCYQDLVDRGLARSPDSWDDSAVDILTGDPEGSLGQQALSSFTLQYDPELNCLYHDEPDNNGEPGTGGRVVVVWPDGYSALRHGDGAVVINQAGDEVARTGESFSLAGGAIGGGSGHCDSIGTWVANGGPRPDQSHPTSPLDLGRAGDCLVGDIDGPPLINVPCEEPHDYELYREALAESSITAFDQAALAGFADDVCAISLQAYVPIAQADGFDYITIYPTEESWNNAEDPDRIVSCLLFSVDGGQLVGRAN